MTTNALAPRFEPAAIEAGIYRRWADAGVFHADAASPRQPYVIVIPPPNVTAVLHMGHGLNNTLQDVMIRFERMRGREALYLPGTDHAGIATQNVVERLLAEEQLSRHDVGRDAFVARVWEHVHRTGDTILDQLKAIGASCDWSRTRFTLDEGYSAAVIRVFVTLYHQGLVYRGHRVIHWCPRCLTSLSDEEARPHDRDAQLYHVRYPLDGGEGEPLVIATTRPETIFADVCLVFHPEDERYQALAGRAVRIPLIDLPIPVMTSDRVERDFGTGLLKVTPAHDANDFEIANELDAGFDRPVVIDEHGAMADDDRVPDALRGLSREEARAATVRMLREAGLLAATEPYAHAVRRCYRCDTVVEPRLSDQWFVRMKPLAEPALDAYRRGAVRFVPDRWGRVYEHWLTEIRDWNISRQLWWGHRIPAWYCQAEGCGEITVAEDSPERCACGGALAQDEDVLDTWFSSWLWPFATFGWPETTPDLERFYPGHTLVTGPDIIFFWVARMIMAGCHFLGETPFDTVYLNGIVRDTQHRKMSKSLGNGIDPLDVVRLYGADALRYTVIAGSAPGADVILDPDDLEASFSVGRNFANKIWNAGRFILSNLDADPGEVDVAAPDLELADRWILHAAREAVGNTTDLLSQFRFNEAANAVYHFFWDELADWYIEQVKPRLYGTAPGGDTARAVLMHVFQTALRLLHPLMPFVTEELWGHLPGTRDGMLAAAAWPQPSPDHADAGAARRFGLVQAAVTAVRSIRSEYDVPPATPVRAVVESATAEAAEALRDEARTVERLAKVSALTVLDLAEGEPTHDGIGAHAVLPDGSGVFVPLGDAIDVRKECERLAGEMARLDKQLGAVAAKLANDNFVRRAPEDVVDREREKERAWREKRDTLAAKLSSLGC